MAQNVVSTRKIIGGLFILIPLPMLVCVLAGYAITSFLLKSEVMTGQISRVILGIFGVVVIASLILIPIGLFLLIKKDRKAIAALHRRAGYDQLSEEHVEFIGGSSLGAFLNPFVWALGNHLYWWALGLVVPIWGLYVWIRLIADGRRLSWEKGWSTIGFYQESQKTLLKVIGILIAVQVLVPLIFYTSVFASLSALRGSIASRTSGSSISSIYCGATFVDSDGDGLTTYEEQHYFHTDPNASDTDDDGFDDLTELLHAHDAGSTDGVALTDQDGDGVPDVTERVLFHSRLDMKDTNGDGIDDGEAVKQGFNPSYASQTLDTVKAARLTKQQTYDAKCAQK